MNKNKGEESHFGLIAAQSGLKAVVSSERSLCVGVYFSGVCLSKYSYCVSSVSACVLADKSTCERRTFLQKTLFVYDAVFAPHGKSGKYEFST